MQLLFLLEVRAFVIGCLFLGSGEFNQFFMLQNLFVVVISSFLIQIKDILVQFLCNEYMWECFHKKHFVNWGQNLILLVLACLLAFILHEVSFLLEVIVLQREDLCA